MGRVRTTTVKKSARVIVEKYYSKLTLDFQTNKKITQEVASIPSKRLRNKIAGFVTHLMKRIGKGPVRGISLKLQEEERVRRREYAPGRSEVDVDVIRVDSDTKQLLKSLGMGPLRAFKVMEDVRPWWWYKHVLRVAAAEAAAEAAGIGLSALDYSEMLEQALMEHRPTAVMAAVDRYMDSLAAATETEPRVLDYSELPLARTVTVPRVLGYSELLGDTATPLTFDGFRRTYGLGSGG